jgi:hypothetical protein
LSISSSCAFGFNTIGLMNGDTKVRGCMLLDGNRMYRGGCLVLALERMHLLSYCTNLGEDTLEAEQRKRKLSYITCYTLVLLKL